MSGRTARDAPTDLALCLLFLTRIPLPPIDMGGRRLADALWAAPLIGAGIGLCGGLVLMLARAAGLPAGLAAALALAAGMALTGCLHEDGLADTADGFAGGRTPERKLEIMRDSRIGTYGACALGVSLLLRWNALAALGDPASGLAALVAAHAASRALLPAFMHLVPSARTSGLSASVGAVGQTVAAAAAAIGLAALLLLGAPAMLCATLLLALAFALLRGLCLAQIGGQTGDTLGALQQVAEILVLITAVAWQP